LKVRKFRFNEDGNLLPWFGAVGEHIKTISCPEPVKVSPTAQRTPFVSRTFPLIASLPGIGSEFVGVNFAQAAWPSRLRKIMLKENMYRFRQIRTDSYPRFGCLRKTCFISCKYEMNTHLCGTVRR